MVLDITEDIIRDRFANVQKAVMGERTLIEKLIPAIALRERRLDREMLPMKMFKDEQLEPFCIDVVAYGALYDAFPQLDVVLTPNGLAAVGNNTLAPASAARSQTARESLASLLFQSQEALLLELRRNEEWLMSRWSSMFRRSLIVSLTDLCALNPDRTSDTFGLAQVMQLKAAIEEDRLAQKFFSPELMAHLRDANLADTLSIDEQQVVNRIKNAVSIKIESKGQKGEILIDVVDYIRVRPEEFPLWHSSRVAMTFVDHRFKNSKRSGGYFL